jgi:peptidoglycan/xylan/chitin deacetylase (PgdA/CDA1 family)
VLALAAMAGCHAPLEDVDGAFYDGDHRRVHCAVDLDHPANSRTANLDAGLDRAVARGEVIELFAHEPGRTVAVAKIAHVLEQAAARDLAFVTYADFAHGDDVAPGIALSFDDESVDAWVELRPLFQQYRARVTFFVSRYHQLGQAQRAGLALLAADGHDIQAHSVHHTRAPIHVEEHGLNAYLRDEVDPSIAVLRDQGFEVTAFAYPFGARTSELDDAIAKRVPILRSVSFSYDLVQDPCPR